jgi:Fe-S-cluster containining protein
MAGADLVQIVDAALAEAARKAGAWLACRPGCCECCIGPFAISTADAVRLRQGLAAVDLEVAARIVDRARASVARLERDYPGDTLRRVLDEDAAGDDERCPALNPETDTCDLYAWRPITCRTFGPPVHFAGEALAVCELCFDGATPEQIAECEVEIDLDFVADEAPTIVAYALAPGLRPPAPTL